MEETLEHTRVEVRRHSNETLAQIKEENEEQQRVVEEEIERFYKEQQRRIDKKFKRLEEESDARLRALFDAFVAAIKQTVRDPDTVLKIWNAVEAKLARPRAAGSATAPHQRQSDT